MEHSHWTALQTVYPPDQIKTINWASLNKHIHNSLDLLRQSANSLNELSHTSSSSQNLPLWTCLLTDLSHLELETPTGCGNDKEWDGAAVVVTEQLLCERRPPGSPGSWCDFRILLWPVLGPATLMAQGSILHTLSQAQIWGVLPWNLLQFICCHYLPTRRKARMEANPWKSLNDTSAASPCTQWPTKHNQTSSAIPSLNISFGFRDNDFSLE